MKEACEEKYVFHDFAAADLDEASGCLEAMKRHKRGLTSTTMVKYATIAYSRPFSECRGIDNKKKHLLSIEVVPKDYRTLHKKVLEYRNRIIAHTDLNSRNPKLVKCGIMIKSEGDYLALVGEMEVLIREVRSAVHNKIIEYGRRFIK